ncbi:MAG TPA: hypothetical protein VNT42_04675 [Sphingomonas sp.]|nr:hypothetical protein [Sphingomonas sp.]
MAWFIALLTAGSGLALIGLGVVCDRSWLDHHILPHMFVTRAEQVLWWKAGRMAALCTGAVTVCIGAPLAWRRVRRGTKRDLVVRAIQLALAVLLSLITSELALRGLRAQKFARWAAREEPLRGADALRGWSNIPNRTGYEDYYGQHIIYRIDAAGIRIGGHQIDPARPSILFTGESIMFGYRLNWPQTIAGQIEARSGLQSVNLAVNGYGTDQSFMPLAGQLDRFARPVAVVALFTPALIERNLGDDRPRLDAALRWHGPARHWGLYRLARNLIPYRSSRQVEDGIARSRAVLQATVDAAHARHARALILVPSFTAENPIERMIRRRVLDDAALPYIFVRLDPRWHLPNDGHPDARANRVMAQAVMAGLDRQNGERLRSAFIQR